MFLLLTHAPSYAMRNALCSKFFPYQDVLGSMQAY